MPYLSRYKKVIYFIHRIDNTNSGDLATCPMQYFLSFQEYLHTRQWDIDDDSFIEKIKPNDIVILGGGGLFNCLEPWNRNINRILDRCFNVFGWSLGFNSHYDGLGIKTKINFDGFKLITIRDFNHPSNFEFLPCISCLIKDLDSKYRIKRKIGILAHKNYDVDLPYEKLSNREPLNKIIEFIGSSEIIMTNSYHACYWATLMGKKVILINPFSTKFNYFENMPITYSGNVEYDISISRNYDNLLSRYRKMNLDFFRRVAREIL